MNKTIIKTEKIKWQYIITVLCVPNWIEKIFGYKEKSIQFISSDEKYLIGGDIKWFYYPSMAVFGRFTMLDAFVRRVEIGAVKIEEYNALMLSTQKGMNKIT